MDPTDGVTPVTGLTIGAADQAEVLKADGTATAAMAGTLAAVTGADGWYDYTLSTTDTEDIGTLEVVLQDASASLPLFYRGQVIDPVTYDAIYGASPTMLTSLDIGQLYESTIGTVTGQTEFICDVTIISDDNWIGNIVTIEDVSTGETVTRWVTDVVQSTDTIHINAQAPFTVITADKVRVHNAVHAQYALNTYDPPTRAELTTDTNSILAKLLNYVQLLVRKDAAIATDNAAEVTAINADEGSGVGTFANTADSLEARADAVDDVNVRSVAGGSPLTGSGTGGQGYGE